MKKGLLFLFSFLSFSFIRAQSIVPDQIRTAETTMRTLTGQYRGQFVQGIEAPPGEVVKEYYYNNYWSNASILLKDDAQVYHFPVKYNIKNESIEIHASNGTKVLDLFRVKSMVWIDSETQQQQVFVNGMDFLESDVPVAFLLEVLVDGKIPLLKRKYVYIKKPDYNVAMNVGSRDELAFQQIDYFVASGKNLFKIKSKKDLLSKLEENQEELKAYLKENRIDVKREEDLKQLLTFYNSQFKKEG